MRQSPFFFEGTKLTRAKARGNQIPPITRIFPIQCITVPVYHCSDNTDLKFGQIEDGWYADNMKQLSLESCAEKFTRTVIGYSDKPVTRSEKPQFITGIYKAKQNSYIGSV